MFAASPLAVGGFEIEYDIAPRVSVDVESLENRWERGVYFAAFVALPKTVTGNGFSDALGSPTAAFNEEGELCWAETYAPYGQKLDNEDKVAEPTRGCGLLGTDVGYTGHVQDGSGLVYAQQRYYDPEIGRFLSTDPTMPSAGDPRYFGRYHYGANNPYSYTDPTGENFFGGIGQTISETIEGVFGTGDGEFNGDAFAEGYDGESGVGGFAAAAGEDAVGLFGGWAVSGAVRGALALNRVRQAASAADKAIDASRATQSGIGVTRHGLNQKINRGVKSVDELDALKNPLDVKSVKVDKLGRPSQRHIGQKAEVATNPETGKIVSVNPTSTRKAERLMRRGQN